jgi:hypothetical protein
LALESERHLFVSMLKEEWRLHKSMMGPFGSGFFPAFIFVLCSALAVVASIFLEKIRYSTFLLMLHVAAALYGIFVGALGHVGEQVMARRLGQINMLLHVPQILPISFRRAMAVFYLKDALFYILYSFVPLTAGVAVAAPLAGVALGSVALLGVTLVLTFMMGMGLSFLLSAIAARSRSAAGALGLPILGVVLMVWPLGVLEPGRLLLPLGYWDSLDPLLLVASLFIAFILPAAALPVIRERIKSTRDRHVSSLLSTESRFAFTGEMSTLLAKEWLELFRSGTLTQAVVGFVGLILGVYTVVWLFEASVGIPLPFNVVSYTGFLGLLGVMTYSWITNVEHNESLNSITIGVDRVIEAKVFLYLLLMAAVSAGYVIMIGLARNEINLIPLGLLVAGATSVYAVAVTAYLTGLWTNTMFFDARVLAKFSAAVVPPLTAIEMASLLMGSGVFPAVGLMATASLLQIAFSIPILRGLRSRWKGKGFSFAVAGS